MVYLLRANILLLIYVLLIFNRKCNFFPYNTYSSHHFQEKKNWMNENFNHCIYFYVYEQRRPFPKRFYVKKYSHKFSLHTPLSHSLTKVYMKILLIYVTLYKLLTFPMAFEIAFIKDSRQQAKSIWDGKDSAVFCAQDDFLFVPKQTPKGYTCVCVLKGNRYISVTTNQKRGSTIRNICSQ